MFELLNIIYKKVIGMFGNVKYFRYPLFILYDPTDYNITQEDYDNFEYLLIPGDIVLRTYDHYLDGAVIPGFYSHASLYIGDKKIIHAIDEGVSEISLFDFAKCDGLAIIRPNVSDKDKWNAIKYVKDNLGKEYDYWFNFNTPDTYCCTELVYWAYLDKISLEPKALNKFFGLIKQEIISPDDYLDISDCELIWESSYSRRNRII